MILPLPFLVEAWEVSQNLGGWRWLSPHVATRLATVIGGYVVLILLLQLQTVESSRRPLKDKLGVVSEICNRQKNALLVGYSGAL